MTGIQDPEVVAIGHIQRVLDELEIDQQDRVLIWALSRFGSDRLWRFRQRTDEQD